MIDMALSTGREKNMNKYQDPCAFDMLFTKNVPHILEKIFLSLDYGSLKNSLEINKAWNRTLTSKTFKKKAKNIFHREIVEDEKKLDTFSRTGNGNEVRKLLAIGMVDVDHIDDHGCTPLYKAVSWGHRNIAKMLLDEGADPNKANKYGCTMLYLAVKNGPTELVKLLILTFI